VSEVVGFDGRRAYVCGGGGSSGGSGGSEYLHSFGNRIGHVLPLDTRSREVAAELVSVEESARLTFRVIRA